MNPIAQVMVKQMHFMDAPAHTGLRGLASAAFTLAFGWVSHFCFGAPLARMEGQIACETLLRRLPNLELAPGPLVSRSNSGLRGLEALPVTFQAARN